MDTAVPRTPPISAVTSCGHENIALIIAACLSGSASSGISIFTIS